jgi:formate C-acetyltransferase
LYGVDCLIEDKKAQLESLDVDTIDEFIIRLREEISEQVKALFELKEMAASYGFDISHPAANAKEALQWLYLAYLAAVKEQNGAARCDRIGSIGSKNTLRIRARWYF